MRTLLILVAVASCNSATQKRCDALVERALACDTHHGLTAAMQTSMRTYCQVTLDEQLPPDDHASASYVARAAVVDCSAATDCATFSACTQRHECVMLFTSVDDRQGQFSCSK